MPVKAEEMPTVRSADNMSREDFEMHMNMRHHDSIGGMTHLTLSASQPYINLCWRKFHDKLHKWRLDLEHKHGPYRPDKEDE